MLKRSLWKAIVLAAMALAMAEPAGAVVLRYDLKAGDEIKYELQTASRSKMSGIGAEGLEVEAEMTQTFQLKVLRVDTAGQMEIEKETLKGEMTIRAQEEERKIEIPQSKKKFRLSPLGEVSKIEEEKPEEETKAAGAGEEDIGSMVPFEFEAEDPQEDFLISGIYLPLPSKDVKVGENWEKEIVIDPGVFAMEGGHVEPIIMKVKSKLAELGEYEGHKFAKIETTHELSLAGNMDQGGMFAIEIEGKMVGALEWYLYYEESKTRFALGDISMLAKMEAKFPPEIAERLPPSVSTEGTSTMITNLKARLLD